MTCHKSCLFSQRKWVFIRDCNSDCDFDKDCDKDRDCDKGKGKGKDKDCGKKRHHRKKHHRRVKFWPYISVGLYSLVKLRISLLRR